MQYSQFEHEMQNSPLKCSTNNEEVSPEKGRHASPKLQAQAYKSSSEKASPLKKAGSLKQSPTRFSPSPNKNTAENAEE